MNGGLTVNRFYLAALGTCLLLPLAAAADQVCNDAALHTTPTHRFEIQPGGIAVDRRTRLTWMRCPLGFAIDDQQTPDDFADDRCAPTGTAVYMTWRVALGTAAEINAASGFAGFDDWRLPNVKELVSIVERKCMQPAWNTAVFPEVHFARTWTSTTHERLDEADYVEFEYGNNDATLKDREWQVRLVRSN